MKPYIYLSVSYQSDGEMVRDAQQTLQKIGIDYKRHEGKEYDPSLLTDSVAVIFFPPMYGKRKIEMGVGLGQSQELELAKKHNILSYFVCDSKNISIVAFQIDWKSTGILSVYNQLSNNQNNHTYLNITGDSSSVDCKSVPSFIKYLDRYVFTSKRQTNIVDRRKLLLLYT